MQIIEAHQHSAIAFRPRPTDPAAFFAKHASQGGCRKVAAHQFIWIEGDVRREIFLIRSGVVCFSRMLMDGRRVVTGFAYPGDIIGLGSAVHARNAEAVQCCKLETMTIAAFQRATGMDAAFARFAQDHVSAELLHSYEHLMVLTKMTASERLAHFLMDLSKRNLRVGHSPTSVLIPMRRIDIADHLGLTIETVSRTFTCFKAAGLIAMEDPAVVYLIDPARLAALASGVDEEEGSVSIRRKLAA